MENGIKCGKKILNVHYIVKASQTKMDNFVHCGKKIIGAAANYHSLIKLLNIPVPKAPEVFLKPTTSYIEKGQAIVIPRGFSVNQEIELGVIIGRKGKYIKESEAMDYIGGYCVALDMTATSALDEARKKGGSWTIGKGFDTACPVSEFIPKCKIPDPHCIELYSSVNGELKQKGNTNDLIFSIPQLISSISQYMTLEENDLIVTGSPPGMGPVKPGDVIEGGIEGLVKIKFCVESARE